MDSLLEYYCKNLFETPYILYGAQFCYPSFNSWRQSDYYELQIICKEAFIYLDVCLQKLSESTKNSSDDNRCSSQHSKIEPGG
jgi:hypothetical protein